MSTGIETWNMNLLEIGPMYPFPGFEMLIAILGIASWIIWHLIQIRQENQILDEDEELLSTPEKLLTAMHLSNAETLIESMHAHDKDFKG